MSAYARYPVCDACKGEGTISIPVVAPGHDPAEPDAEWIEEEVPCGVCNGIGFMRRTRLSASNKCPHCEALMTMCYLDFSKGTVTWCCPVCPPATRPDQTITEQDEAAIRANERASTIREVLYLLRYIDWPENSAADAIEARFPI